VLLSRLKHGVILDPMGNLLLGTIDELVGPLARLSQDLVALGHHASSQLELLG
jgi:hypothetical protein